MVNPEQDPVEPKRSRDFKDYLPNDTRDIMAYLLLALGIILMFVEPLWGGLLVGVVAGAYFSKQLLAIVRNFDAFIDTYGTVKSIILTGVALAFLIAAPAIFIGIVLVMVTKLFLNGSST